MATVRPGVMEAKKRNGTGQCRIVEKKVKLLERERLTEILAVVREKKSRVNLSDATVIVAGGRGAGSKEGLECIVSLAEALGGEVAGTRIVIEEGWLPAERQVGQTGQTVRPELYIACGISGAIQHRAGMLGSRYVIAINTDERAPIFEVADWGIVGNLHEVVPTLRYVDVSARLASPMITCSRRYLSASACGSSRVLMMPRLRVVSKPTSTSM